MRKKIINYLVHKLLGSMLLYFVNGSPEKRLFRIKELANHIYNKMKHLVSVKNKTNRMKKKKYLHTQFVKFLLESESQAQNIVYKERKKSESSSNIAY